MSQLIPLNSQIVLEKFREFLISRLLLDELGPGVAAEILEYVLGRPVQAAVAGRAGEAVQGSLVEEMLGAGRIQMADRFKESMKEGMAGISSPADLGRVLIDAGWLEKFMANPRALYLLLDGLKAYQDAATRKLGTKAPPLIAFVVNDAREKDQILKRIREVLVSQGRDLGFEEDIVVRGAILPNLENLIEIVAPEAGGDVFDAINAYVAANDYGVATLLSDLSAAGQIVGEADFVLNPKKVADKDVQGVSFLPTAIMKAAVLIRGVPLDRQVETLERQMKDILPGASRATQAFVIQLAQFIESLRNQQRSVLIAA
jgi:hypothetical protein